MLVRYLYSHSRTLVVSSLSQFDYDVHLYIDIFVTNVTMVYRLMNARILLCNVHANQNQAHGKTSPLSLV
jgi:hypothetical protein